MSESKAVKVKVLKGPLQLPVKAGKKYEMRSQKQGESVDTILNDTVKSYLRNKYVEEVKA